LQEELDKELLNVGPTPTVVPKLPDAPETALPAAAAKTKGKKQQEDNDLAELEAWANA
jgi:hypothetical protein